MLAHSLLLQFPFIMQSFKSHDCNATKPSESRLNQENHNQQPSPGDTSKLSFGERSLTLACRSALGPGQRADPGPHVVRVLSSHADLGGVQNQVVVGVDERQVLHAETPQLV